MDFTGYIPDEAAYFMLLDSDVGLVTYTADYPPSIPTKPFNYLFCGLAIVSSLEGSFAQILEREQFGKPLARHQAIQFMLADMGTRTEAARLLTLKAAVKKHRKERYSLEAALAKLYASETAMWVAHKAVQIHGGYGYVREYNVERYFRDAKITEIYEGTSEIQRMIIAKEMMRD